jgi:hypothetical protein
VFTFSDPSRNRRALLSLMSAEQVKVGTRQCAAV